MSGCTCGSLFNTPCKECTQFESIDEYELDIEDDEDDEE